DGVALKLTPAVAPNTGAEGDNQLSPAEKAEGYVLLFDGKNLDGFGPSYARLTHSKWIVEDGVIHTCLFGGLPKYVYPGHLYTSKEYKNYVLKFDLRVPAAPKGTHSGVILRVGGKPPDAEAAGLEVNIYGCSKKVGHYTTGSFRHDLQAPAKDALKTDGSWNHVVITVKGSLITVEINGDKVNEINLDDFATPGKRPDGSDHRLTKLAVKDMPQQGRIGFRDDHGNPVSYKNIKLKPLP
ncbi:MAG: DUF1080 domain-containing protein, partial [Gemmataceae bacterium]